jgi:hypothetical protein
MKKIRVLLLEIDGKVTDMLKRYFEGDSIELIILNSAIKAQEEINSGETSENRKFDLIFFDSRIVEERGYVDAAVNKVAFGKKFFITTISEVTKKRFTASGYQCCMKGEIFAVISAMKVAA